MSTQSQAVNRSRYPPAFRAWTLLLLAAVLSFAPAGLSTIAQRPWEALLWTAFIAAANLVVVPMLPKQNVDASLGTPVSVAAAVVLPLPAAVLVNFAGLTSSRMFHRGASWWPILYNRAQIGLCAGAAGYVAMLLDRHWWWATLAAVAVYQLTNTVAIAAGLSFTGRLDLPRAALRSQQPFPRFATEYGLVALLAVLIVAVEEMIGPPAVLLLAVPGLLGYQALQSAREASDRADQLAERVADLELLHHLSGRLLSYPSPEAVADALEHLLTDALSCPVRVVSDGRLEAGWEATPIPDAEPAVIGLPFDAAAERRPVVAAAARLAGLALQRWQLERELAEVEAARAALGEDILAEGARERTRLALAMHDEVLPMLAALELQADNICTASRREMTEKVQQIAGTLQNTAAQATGHLRQVLTTIRDSAVPPGELRYRVEAALGRLALTGVDTYLICPSSLPPLPLPTEILAVEAVRGLLANVERHARASRVRVSLEVEDGHLRAIVADDGVGFDPQLVPDGHHGLALLAQRVALARGEMRIDAAPGSGSRVHVRLPVSTSQLLR